MAAGSQTAATCLSTGASSMSEFSNKLTPIKMTLLLAMLYKYFWLATCLYLGQLQI